MGPRPFYLLHTSKRDRIMKQNILILSSRTDHTAPAYNALVEHGIPVTVATDTQSALLALYTHTPAFLWLDLDTESARSFLAEITKQFLNPPPYIILTSSFSDSTDRADMLDQGADACVEVPVDLSEIAAILNAVLRREGRLKFVHPGSLLPCIEHKELFIDPLRRQVQMRGKAIELTSKEFDLLHLLANSPGTVFTREQIYSHIWKTQASLGTSTVTNHISSLRQKLGLHPKDGEYIQTIFGVGYRFADSV